MVMALPWPIDPTKARPRVGHGATIFGEGAAGGPRLSRPALAASLRVFGRLRSAITLQTAAAFGLSLAQASSSASQYR